jgi:hypothetical protein
MNIFYRLIIHCLLCIIIIPYLTNITNPIIYKIILYVHLRQRGNHLIDKHF